MKKIILILLISASFSACTDLNLDEQTIKVQNLDGYVAFANSGGTVVPIVLNIRETSTATSNLRIECPTGSLSDITVNYSFSGSATFGSDFTVVATNGGSANASGGTIVLRRNTTTGGVNDFDFVNLGIRPVLDGVVEGTEQLIVTLTSATDASGKVYTVGRGNYMKSATINIAD